MVVSVCVCVPTLEPFWVNPSLSLRRVPAIGLLAACVASSQETRVTTAMTKQIQICKRSAVITLLLACHQANGAFNLVSQFFPHHEPSPARNLAVYSQGVLEQATGLPSAEEAFEDMALVGMKEIAAVKSFTVKRTGLKSKLLKEFAAKDIPQKMMDAFIENVEEVPGELAVEEMFHVDPNGAGYIIKVVFTFRPDPKNEELCQVAFAVSGSSFDAAKELVGQEEQETPVFVRWRPSRM